MFSIRNIITIVLVVVFSHLLGAPFPLRMDDPGLLLIDLTLFLSYIYFAWTLFRLPFVLLIAYWRFRQTGRESRLTRQERLAEAWIRAADRRRWTVGKLAQLDRLGFMMIVFLGTPVDARGALQLFGFLGLCLLLSLYFTTGRYEFLLGEISRERNFPSSLPFLDT